MTTGQSQLSSGTISERRSVWGRAAEPSPNGRQRTAVLEAAATSTDAVRLEHLTRMRLVAKRLLDVLIASLTLVIALPLMVLIAVGIKVTDRGPVFFVQERVGRGGTPFKILKFRTMRVGTHSEVLADELQRRRYVANDYKLPADDPRITGIGAVLRRLSLDELPQLLNVLFGQMSLVGVRPLLRAELADRPAGAQQWYQALRPGMTGLWQVEGRSRTFGETRLALDRRYVEEWSLTSDFLLLLRTPFAVTRVHQTH